MASPLSSIQTGLNNVSNAVSNASQVIGSLSGGTPILNGSSNSLPADFIPALRSGTFRRDIIHWFVPSFGTVTMYINPSNINYRYKKLITRDRTRGGYTLQYWGEDLTTLAIAGSTGSSGIEGINILEEVYRAEQLAFDSVGQTLAANSAASGSRAQILSGIGSALSQTAGGVNSGGPIGGVLGSGIAQGIFGSNVFTALAPRNIPSIASFAFGVQMFYSGVIYKGYFEDFTVTESAQNLGIFEYTLNFTTTQKSGLRLNQFPWQRAANAGPSNNEQSAGVPLSWYDLQGQ
jgi:hypothetical protein